MSSSAQETRDREMALELQQRYQNEFNLREATETMYRNDNGTLSPDLRPKSLRSMVSSIISMPYSKTPAPSDDRSQTAYSGQSSPPTNPAYLYTAEGHRQTQTQQETNRRLTNIFRRDRPTGPGIESNTNTNTNKAATSDFTLARALQAMEFEMADETLSMRNSANTRGTGSTSMTDDRHVLY